MQNTAKKRRGFRINQGVQVVLVLAIAVGLVLFAKKYPARFDWTQTGRFTLSPETDKVLSGLLAPVDVLAFFQKNSPDRARFEDLIGSYTYKSDKIRLQFVDPDQELAKAKQYGIRSYGTVYIAMGERHVQITELTESALTNALIQVSHGEKKKIRVLSGHGERSISDREAEGLSTAAEELGKLQYDVSELLLLESGAVPEDTDLLVIPTPVAALLPQELEILKTYFAKEGIRVFFLADPILDGEDRLAPLLALFSVRGEKAVVIDPVSRLFGGDYAVPVVSEYPPHPITQGFKTATFFPLAAPLRDESEEGDPWRLSPIAQSQATAWGESGKLAGEVRYDEGVDIRGPVSIVLAGERDALAPSKSESPPESPEDKADKAPASRFVIAGDGDFASNAYYDFSGNSDFLKNIVHWLASEEAYIAIHPKEVRKGEFALTPGEGRVLFGATVVAIPLLLALLSVRVFWRLRKQ